MRVYIISDKGDLKKLQYLFSKFSEINQVDSDEIYHVLDREELHNPKDCTLLIKQSCTSNLDSDKVYEVINALQTKKSEFDIFYLTTWGDACQKRREFWKKHNIYTCHEPNGLQAVMLTPMGRKRILGLQKMKNGHKFQREEHRCLGDCLRDAVMNNELTAITSFPPLVHFDHSSATHNTHYAYLNHCRAVNCNDSNNNTTAYVWFIVAFVLLLLIVWAYWFGKRRYY